MRIGLTNYGWWKEACQEEGHETISLPAAVGVDGNAHGATLASRTAMAAEWSSMLSDQPVENLLDHGGTGLSFLPSQQNDSVDLFHERMGLPLVSQFVDPVTTSFQGLDWPVVWQCFQSNSWIKAIWDRAHANELQQFGVPGVVHVPMAAPVRTYDTNPLDLKQNRPVVSFVGGQNTNFFANGLQFPSAELLPGTLVSSIQADLPQVSFYDAYHDIYRLGDPPQPNDPTATRIAKIAAYYQAKLFFHAALCIRRRDRFVIFLKRKLQDLFQLVGRGWDTAYGLSTQPQFPSADAYFDHFRKTAINLNLVNGNAETGLNMRHFEITAAGGFMMCYDQPELADQFEIGKECAVFHSEKDLLDKIQYYLSHPQERVEIALAGQRRTLSQHLYTHRLRHILSLFQATPANPSRVEFSKTTWQEDSHALVPSPDIILDCGANKGQMAEGFRRLYPKAAIYSFEPVSSVFEELKVRCLPLGAHPIPLAVGDFDGRATIHLTASPEANSLLGYQEGNPCAKWTREVGEEQVTVCTLDGWCHNFGIDPRRIDIIKLDVQGAELKALYGASEVLQSAKLILLEVSFVKIYKDCPLFPEIDAFLTECGFRRHALYPSDQPHNWADALYARVNNP
ncbi:MAG: FkbM family methyltransferase [Planctomycetota bacterium]|mgnify:CR=1 FL=1